MRLLRFSSIFFTSALACAGGDIGGDDDDVRDAGVGSLRDGGTVARRDGGTPRDASTNPPSATMSVQLGGRGMLDRSDALDLGVRFVGDDEAPTPFTIVNTGPTPIMLNTTTPVSLAGDVDEFRITAPASLTLGPGEQTTFAVQFAPTVPGSAQVVVRVHHADGSIGPSEFAIEGYGHATGGTPLFIGGGGPFYRLRTTNGEPGTWADDGSRLDETPCPGLGDDHPRDLVRGVGYGDGTFVIAGGSCQGMLATSRDGVAWDGRLFDASYAGFFSDVAWMNGVFAAAGGLGGRAFSTDRGASWTPSGEYSKCHFRRIAAGNGRFVAVGNEFDMGCSSTSVDGETWTPLQTQGPRFDGIAFGNGVFVASSDARCSYSEDGVSWFDCGPNAQQAVSVWFVNGEFVIFGARGIARSLDGATWRITSGPWMDAIAYGRGRYVAVGNGQRGYAETLEAFQLENVASPLGAWAFGYAYP